MQKTLEKIDQLNKDIDIEIDNQVKGLISKRGPNWFPHSRDHDLGGMIPCKRIRCVCNRSGYCETPSLIKINGKAECVMGLKHS